MLRQGHPSTHVKKGAHCVSAAQSLSSAFTVHGELVALPACARRHCSQGELAMSDDGFAHSLVHTDAHGDADPEQPHS